MYIFHCVRKRDFDPSAEFYGEESVKKCGFIHCSDIDTYYLVAPNFKDDYQERILLLINTDKVIPEIKWEDSEGWDFPHIYGLLNTDAIEAFSRTYGRKIGYAFPTRNWINIGANNMTG